MSSIGVLTDKAIRRTKALLNNDCDEKYIIDVLTGDEFQFTDKSARAMINFVKYKYFSDEKSTRSAS